MPPYQELYPVGTCVRIASRRDLEEFARSWRFHHKLKPEQLGYADRVTQVKSVSFYHGGDVLYEFKDVPGTWHEQCARPIGTVEP